MGWKTGNTSVTVKDPISVEGTVETADMNILSLLKALLDQQKITNLYLSTMTDENFNSTDLTE